MAIGKETKKEQFYFAPESMLWKLNRERVVILAGPRAMLMQIAHPLIAKAVYEHGSFRKNPLQRMRKTLDKGLTMIFGEEKDTLATAQNINKVHEKVKGTIEEPIGPYAENTPYSAKDVELSTWVYATLVDSVIKGYHNFVRPLSQTKCQLYYNQSKEIASLLGIEKELLPRSFEELELYINKMIESDIVVSEKAKELSRLIFEPEDSPQTLIAKPLLEFVTLGLLPKKLRDQYGYCWSAWQERTFQEVCQTMRSLVPHLPERLRYVPAYQKAKRIENPFNH